MTAKDGKSGEDLVIAGIEVGGCLVMTPDQLWESRYGKQETANAARVGGQTLDSLPNVLKTLTHTDIQRPQLCVDVHQCRPDPFDPSRSDIYLCLITLLSILADPDPFRLSRSDMFLCLVTLLCILADLIHLTPHGLTFTETLLLYNQLS